MDPARRGAHGGGSSGRLVQERLHSAQERDHLVVVQVGGHHELIESARRPRRWHTAGRNPQLQGLRGDTHPARGPRAW